MTVRDMQAVSATLFLDFGIKSCSPDIQISHLAIPQCRALWMKACRRRHTASKTRANGTPLMICHAMETLIGKHR